MRIPLTITIATLVWSSAYCQENNAELEKRNGFKDIKLGSMVDSLKGAILKKEFKEKKEFPARLYLVEGEKYRSIGEVKITRLEVKTYKQMIYEINVTTVKDPRLMQGLEKALGQPVYSVRTESYHWKAPSLSLLFKKLGKDELQLTYSSYPVRKQMLIDKGKKVDEIADDF